MRDRGMIHCSSSLVTESRWSPDQLCHRGIVWPGRLVHAFAHMHDHPRKGTLRRTKYADPSFISPAFSLRMQDQCEQVLVKLQVYPRSQPTIHMPAYYTPHVRAFQARTTPNLLQSLCGCKDLRLPFLSSMSSL